MSDGIASADRERCGMNMPRRTSVTRSVPDIEAKRRARRRRETKKREWHVRQTPFLDRFRPMPEAVAEKEGFALQRAPIGDRETIYCRAAQACTSHAAKYGCEEKVWGAKKSGKGNAAARSIPLAAPSKRPQQT